jgi:hypothetical protein
MTSSMADTHPWQERIEQRLAALADLEPGWLDGEGRAITQGALVAARQFLNALSVMSVAFPGLIQPGGICPTEDGGVDVEWAPKGGAWVSVEFTPDGRMEAISTNPDGREAQAGFRDE